MITREHVAALSRPLDLRPALRRWETYARRSQLVTPKRPIVNFKAGRGHGKTRLGNEHTLTLCERWGSRMRGLVASKTDTDTIETLVLGDAGLVACARARGYELDYSPSRGVITHPSGAVLQLGSGQNREIGRSLSINYALLDELAWWAYAVESFANIRFALRLTAPAPGRHILVTSTPSYLCKLKLDDTELVQTIRGSTRDNRDNLAPNVIEELERTYAGHPLGAQELDGDDVQLEGALVRHESIHEHRIAPEHVPELDALIVAVDPGGFAVKDPFAADPTGVVVMGIADACEDVPQLYVLHAEAIEGDAEIWAPRVIEIVAHFNANRVIVETNQGGAMLLSVLRRYAGERRHYVTIEPVVASAAKLDRALPLAQQYALGSVRHCAIFKQLESELTTWSPKSGRPSPNMLDAAAHACNALLPEGGAGGRVWVPL